MYVCFPLFVNTISKQLCEMQKGKSLVSVCKQMFSSTNRETRDNYTHTRAFIRVCVSICLQSVCFELRNKQTNMFVILSDILNLIFGDIF